MIYDDFVYLSLRFIKVTSGVPFKICIKNKNGNKNPLRLSQINFKNDPTYCLTPTMSDLHCTNIGYHVDASSGCQ